LIRAEKKAATCGFKNKVDRRFRNTFGKRTGLLQWAQPPSIVPDITTTLAQLDAACKPDSNDQLFSFSFDLNGDRLTKTLTKQIASQLILAPGTNVPSLQDLPPQDLTETYAYDPRRLRISLKHENGTIKYFYYNAIKKLIGKTGVTRTSLSGKKLTPFILYGINTHGEVVLETKFAASVQNPTPDQLPVPEPNPQLDQTKLKLNNGQGLTIAEETEEGAVTFKTYNAAKKIQREYHALTETTPAGSTVHLDEKRIEFDGSYNPVVTKYLRDSVLIINRTAIAEYNSFNQPTSEGERDAHNQDQYYQSITYAPNGFAWKHNKDGSWAIELPNLQGKLTITAKSLTDTLVLSNKQLSDLPDLLNTSKYPYDTLSRTEKDYDEDNNLIIQRAPAYSETTGPTNIPLNVYVGSRYAEDFGKVNLSWLIPKETNVNYPTLEIYPVINSSDPNFQPISTPLNIVTKNGRCGVDVSHLPTGIYGYNITYTLNVGDHPIIYQTTGQVQFESLSNTNSVHVVPIVENNNQIRLTGNTKGLTAVDVWQGKNNLIAKVPVIYDLKKETYYADLSQLASGAYTITPADENIANPIESLPFTIYTNIPSSTPLAREIDAIVNLKWLDSHVELDWQVPDDFAQYKIKLGCVYIGTDGQAHIQEATITPGQVIKTYYDQDNKPLYCNCEFDVPIQSIYRLNVLIALDEDDQNTYIPLLANAIQELVKKPGAATKSAADIKREALPIIQKLNLKAWAFLKTASQDLLFAHHKVNSDGNCGYTALGMSRANAYKLLSKNLWQVGKLIKPVVEELLLEEKFIDYLQKQGLASDTLVKFFKHYQAQAEQGKAVNKFIAQLKKYATHSNILQGYLNYDVRDKKIDAGWAHPLILQALAQLTQKELFIWQPDASGSLIPHASHGHIKSEDANQRVDLIYINGNHFDRLELISDRLQPEEKEVLIDYIEYNHKQTIRRQEQNEYRTKTTSEILQLSLQKAQLELSNYSEQEENINIIQYAAYAPRTIVWIMSIPNPTQYQTFLFKDMREDLQAEWTIMPILRVITSANNNISPGIIIDASGLSYGNYPWMLGQSSESHKLLLKQEQGLEGIFTIVQSGQCKLINMIVGKIRFIIKIAVVILLRKNSDAIKFTR
jgi:hypothetical protein